MADDGAGVRLVQRLAQKYRFPPQVTILDGGTLGLDLLPRLEGVERLVIVDAVETGEASGTLVRLRGEEVPAALVTKISPHQMGLQDLLAVARLLDILPEEIVLWGVQPGAIDVSSSLTEKVAESLDRLEMLVLDELAAWGLVPELTTPPPA